MVEYVLGGSPTNKESPLASLEPRLRALKFDDNDKVQVQHLIYNFLINSFAFQQSNDDKEKSNSPFDVNGMKKEDQVNSTNGVVVVNGIDDDKGFK